MTKTRKSSSRKRKSSSKKQSGANRIIGIIALVILLIFVCIFLFTGSDPLGLFTGDEAAPTRSLSPPTLVGSGGDWWQVYFTSPETVNDPENLAGSIPEKLIEYIDNAQKE